MIYRRSETRFSDITRGTSNTFLLGERYVNPHDYFTGFDPSDNESMFVGYDNDVNRTTFWGPLRDTPGLIDSFRFGSAHASGLNMAYADGHVEFVSWSVDLVAWQPQGSRSGGATVPQEGMSNQAARNRPSGLHPSTSSSGLSLRHHARSRASAYGFEPHVSSDWPRCASSW